MDRSIPVLDRLDQQILAALQRDARLSSAELSEKVNLSASPCWRRVKRLESAGVITGYHARVDFIKLGFEVTALVQVALAPKSVEHMRAFEAAIRPLPEVLSCHNISGQYDYHLVVMAKTPSLFGDFVREHINGCPSIKEVCTSFIISEVKAPVTPPL
ncbi:MULTISPECIES: Lrp/AsnC family transcriptional regulator [Burkholderia]|uniref:Lrp/AsnC family transcriptional regulator n=1 Tax=Burkholderia TaxID=32008 RepID=UPI0004D744F8|nr:MULTISPECIES: Lrp/AsnC family transcriptional regulator [Burkholderia]KER67941.1 AsnC family transcriptional regulator [Burkholderia cepacia]MBR8257603.1 Lrp/AsnC family transcriptional regulator [Burkholderia ambifaria]